MAHTSSPTTARLVILDEVARARAAKLVPHVAARYQPQPRRPYLPGEPAPAPEAVDTAYILTGAIQVGLNRWCLPAAKRPAPELFLPRPAAGVEELSVDVLTTDEERAEALSDVLHVPVAAILSCAAATGLAMLSGSHDIAGPFEV